MRRKRYLLPKEQWPKLLSAYPQVKGIHIGGCVDTFDTTSFVDNPRSEYMEFAHSHTDALDLFHGNLCFLNGKVLNSKYVQIHELAHLLTWKAKIAHGIEWKKTVLSLGGTLKPHSYQLDWTRGIK